MSHSSDESTVKWIGYKLNPIEADEQCLASNDDKRVQRVEAELWAGVEVETEDTGDTVDLDWKIIAGSSRVLALFNDCVLEGQT